MMSTVEGASQSNGVKLEPAEPIIVSDLDSSKVTNPDDSVNMDNSQQDELANGEENDGDDKGKEDENPDDGTLYIRIKGLSQRVRADATFHNNLYDFFHNKMQVALPRVRAPKGRETGACAEMRSKEDKAKVLELTGKGYKMDNGRIIQVVSVYGRFLKKEPTLKPSFENTGDAKNALFKLAGKPYSEQLKDKLTEARATFSEAYTHARTLKEISPKYKKETERLPRISNIVPHWPMYGYALEASVCFVKQESGAVGMGVRLSNKTTDSVVPVDECINIPKAMIDVIKDFQDNLSNYPTIKPFMFNVLEPEGGNIVSLHLKMNHYGEIVMSVGIPVENSFHEEFMDLKTPEMLSEEKRVSQETVKQEPGTNANAITHFGELVPTEVNQFNRKLDTIKDDLEKYFANASKLGVISLGCTWRVFNRRGEWTTGAHFNHFNHHLFGSQSIKEQLNGVEINWWPFKQRGPRNSHYFENVLNTIENLFSINKGTNVLVASDYILLALYFAKKAKQVSCLYSSPARSGKLMLDLHENVKNVEVLNNNAQSISTLHQSKFAEVLSSSKIAIIWDYTGAKKKIFKFNLVQKLKLLSRSLKIVFVINVNYQNMGLIDLKHSLEALAPNWAITRAVPIDTHPHQNEYILVCVAEQIMAPTQPVEMKRMDGIKRKIVEQPVQRAVPKRPYPGPGNKKPGPPGLGKKPNYGPMRERNAWSGDSGRSMPPPLIQSPSMEPLSNTLNKLQGFMQDQMMFNELMKNGIQKMIPRPNSPPAQKFDAWDRPTNRGGEFATRYEKREEPAPRDWMRRSNSGGNAQPSNPPPLVSSWARTSSSHDYPERDRRGSDGNYTSGNFNSNSRRYSESFEYNRAPARNNNNNSGAWSRY